MLVAYAYKRVSSQEQKEKRNSIPEQARRIKEFANSKGIKIIKEFEDNDSAFHDEKRNNFETMIKLAIKERPNFIILDDSSRFARTRKVAIVTKENLRSHGINILYASEPNIDTSTTSGFWLESIQEVKNEATSREIAFHTKKGMSGNLSQRDNETGWCYKNGGKAPYGYKRTILNKGFNLRGKPVYKTIWELDENTFPIVRTIIVDLYTEKEMSYTKIRDYLNDNNIKNSNGSLWSTSTIVSMLKEDRLEEYCGTAIWNKENNNIIGVKYNEKSKWVICENAHPAIITKEEKERALERKNKTKSTKYKYNPNSDYLLTGYNIENEYLFTCAECGGHVIGCSTGKKHVKKYGCANNRHKGIKSCTNNWKIEKEWVEDIIIGIIEKNYFANQKIDKFIDKIYKEISNIGKVYNENINKINREIKNIDKQIQNLLNSIKNGINPELVVDEVNNLKLEKDKLKEIKNKSLKEMENEPKITREDIKEYFYNFKKLFSKSNNNEKKELIKTFISNITFNKKEHQLEINIFPQWCPLLEQVAGIEPA